MKKIRTLKAEEIEVRPQSIKNGKANMLLYINSRAATDLLDECYGMANWNLEYKDVAGQIYGRLSIYDEETNRWVYREDTGSAGNIEAEKSLASDVVKRCIVRFGVTELYSSPKIQIDDDGYGNTGYKVSEIEYNEDREIIHLVIVNRFNKEVFQWNKGDVTPIYKTVPKQAQNNHKTDALDFVIETDFDKLKNFFKTKQKSIDGKEKEELVKFKEYYKKKLEDNSWKGDFNVENLWSKWKVKNIA